MKAVLRRSPCLSETWKVGSVIKDMLLCAGQDEFNYKM